MNVNSDSVRSSVAEQGTVLSEVCLLDQWIDGEHGVVASTCSLVEATRVDANAAIDVLGEEHEVTWSNQDVWSLVEHEALVLLPLDWCAQTGWVQRIERLLLEDGLEHLVDLGLCLGLACLRGRILDAHVDAHILDDIGVDDTD